MEVSRTSSKGKLIASGIIPFAFLVLLIVYIFGPGSDVLDLGVPLPEITMEKVDFVDSEILVTVRNTGPIPVEVVMADINDRIQPAAIEPDRFLERYETALVRIPFAWNEAEPYTLGDDRTRALTGVRGARKQSRRNGRGDSCSGQCRKARRGRFGGCGSGGLRGNRQARFPAQGRTHHPQPLRALVRGAVPSQDRGPCDAVPGRGAR